MVAADPAFLRLADKIQIRKHECDWGQSNSLLVSLRSYFYTNQSIVHDWSRNMSRQKMKGICASSIDRDVCMSRLKVLRGALGYGVRVLPGSGIN